MNFFDTFLDRFSATYPRAASEVDARQRLAPTLFCPDVVKLPEELAEQAKEIVSAFWRLREIPERKQRLETLPPINTPDPGNASALMSFDFHVDTSKNLRLIEINTNASMGLISHVLHGIQNVENAFSPDFSQEILSTFLEEFQLAVPNRKRPEFALVVDEAPTQQRLFVEHLMYRDLFESAGIPTTVADPREVTFVDGELRHAGRRVDLVYNRHTDFYLELPETASLRAAYVARAACVSPNPHEYRLLADKERLRELSHPGAVEELPLNEQDRAIIEKTLIHTLDVADFKDPAELWSLRKNFFFKPKRSFGGKAAYRGSSISRGIFERISTGEYLAQEYVPAPTIRVPSTPDVEFKYDLRFFVYKDRIQLASARLYQGQMTNSQTPGGGVAVIEWE